MPQADPLEDDGRKDVVQDWWISPSQQARGIGGGITMTLGRPARSHVWRVIGWPSPLEALILSRRSAKDRFGWTLGDDPPPAGPGLRPRLEALRKMIQPARQLEQIEPEAERLFRHLAPAQEPFTHTR